MLLHPRRKNPNQKAPRSRPSPSLSCRQPVLRSAVDCLSYYRPASIPRSNPLPLEHIPSPTEIQKAVASTAAGWWAE
jgi:hypothetical protein